MDYEGVIIEESLDDKAVLYKVKIVKTEVEKVTKKHATPWYEQWTLHTVRIPEKNASAIARELSRSISTAHDTNWYADFQNDKFHYIVFKGKVFKVRLGDEKGYSKATDYGISLGIPAYQVDFSPFIEKWRRENHKDE